MKAVRIIQATRVRAVRPLAAVVSGDHGFRSTAFFGVGGLLSSVVALGSLALCEDEPEAAVDEKSLTQTASSMVTLGKDKVRIVGEYENRIRDYAAPEKVFEYFASIQLDDGMYMTVNDFVRSVMPFTPWNPGKLGTANDRFQWSARKSRSTEDEAERHFELMTAVSKGDKAAAAELSKHMDDEAVDPTTHYKCLRRLGLTASAFHHKLFDLGQGDHHRWLSEFYDVVDHNGDGLISFGEYMFFVSLLAVPSNSIDLAFRYIDLDGDGGVDRREFVKLMERVRSNSPAGRQAVDKNLLGKELGRFEDGLPLERFFDRDGDTHLTPDKFGKYMKSLHKVMKEAEFRHWDISRSGKLNPAEFGSMIVAHTPPRRRDKYLQKLEAELPALNDKDHVTLEDYYAFTELLNRLPALEVALDVITSTGSDAGVTQGEFYRATCAALSGYGPGLSESTVAIIFAMFDDDGDGSLSDDEFLKVMIERRQGALQKERSSGISDKIVRCVDCFKHAFM